MLSGFGVYSNILKSERSTLTDFMIGSVKKLMVDRQRQWVRVHIQLQFMMYLAHKLIDSFSS